MADVLERPAASRSCAAGFLRRLLHGRYGRVRRLRSAGNRWLMLGFSWKVMPVTYMDGAAIKLFCGERGGLVCTSGRAGMGLRAPGKKSAFARAREGPFQGGARVRRGADQTSALSAEGLDRCGGVHVGHRHDSSGRARRRPAIPSSLQPGRSRPYRPWGSRRSDPAAHLPTAGGRECPHFPP